jgi:hypothetical protein
VPRRHVASLAGKTAASSCMLRLRRTAFCNHLLQTPCWHWYSVSLIHCRCVAVLLTSVTLSALLYLQQQQRGQCKPMFAGGVSRMQLSTAVFFTIAAAESIRLPNCVPDCPAVWSKHSRRNCQVFWWRSNHR